MGKGSAVVEMKRHGKLEIYISKALNFEQA